MFRNLLIMELKNSLERKMSEIEKKIQEELKLVNGLHKNLNETIDLIDELQRLSYDLRDSLKSTSGYFNSSPVRRVNLSKWNEVLEHFRFTSAQIESKLFNRGLE
jgi:hypothetical protein